LNKKKRSADHDSSVEPSPLTAEEVGGEEADGAQRDQADAGDAEVALSGVDDEEDEAGAEGYDDTSNGDDDSDRDSDSDSDEESESDLDHSDADDINDSSQTQRNTDGLRVGSTASEDTPLTCL